MLNRFTELFKIPELRNKILLILGLLVFFRLLSAIPLPGVDVVALSNLLKNNQALGFLNVFSGGSLGNLSVALLGVGPYITATIILQLLTMIFPRLKEMYYEEGAIGRSKFNRLSRYLTIPLAVVQTFGFLNFLSTQGVVAKAGIGDPVLWLNILTAVAASMILLWVGERIDEQKMGNGVSLIIFAGIVSRFPSYIKSALVQFQAGALGIDSVIFFLVFVAVVVTAIVFVSQGEHRIAVSYPKRAQGNRVSGGVSSYLPIKVNQAGVIPIIFAMALLSFPQIIGNVALSISSTWGSAINDAIIHFIANQFLYGIFYFILVFVFTYFYTAVVFDPAEVSKNLQRSGGFVPGIRPGDPTKAYISSIIKKTTLFGATFLGLVAVLPFVSQAVTGMNFMIGGTSILIVISVAMEWVNQADSQLKMREYDIV